MVKYIKFRFHTWKNWDNTVPLSVYVTFIKFVKVLNKNGLDSYKASKMVNKYWTI